MSAGTLAWPATGGFLMELAGWPLLFWINVPVGLAAFVLGMRLFPDNERSVHPSATDTKPLDLRPPVCCYAPRPWFPSSQRRTSGGFTPRCTAGCSESAAGCSSSAVCSAAPWRPDGFVQDLSGWTKASSANAIIVKTACSPTNKLRPRP
ncbi:MFS transporter [Paenibacillus hemerocallicola]|uniref:MFS transporter n=1 Tax=Paenibacillus hemerocallicola TaxID=1172614 RepID=A0A5C4T0X7_9BACL|nr:MFS transporter [Paenibacillus hemerocallicola]